MKQFERFCFGMIILPFFICIVSAAQGLCVELPQDTDNTTASDRLANTPKIKFDKLSHDFGKAVQSATLKHTFAFKNIGNGVLLIEKVKAG